MSNAVNSRANSTTGLQYQGTLEKLGFSIMATLPCCSFLYINGVLLFTLRSKPVFRETSRYILLYNLLSADTSQLALSQFLYLLAAFRITLTLPVCGTVALTSLLASLISPLTLAVMSLERYVAVCFPLRHPVIITVRSTGAAIGAVWAFSLLNIITRILLLSDIQVEGLHSRKMRDFCNVQSLLLTAVAYDYDRASTCVIFVTVSATVSCSYIGVIFAARSAASSSDKASVIKVRKTLTLHMLQLVLSLTSTLQIPLLIVMVRFLDRIMIVRIMNVMYVCMDTLPRCLSALIYGLRDQTIRPVLTYNLGCQRRSSDLAPRKTPQIACVK